jgi:hypothetical protein
MRRETGMFYGWIIVGVGIVVTCVGFGAMSSLTVFLRPMGDAMGWSRTGVSTAALVREWVTRPHPPDPRHTTGSVAVSAFVNNAR